jgi:hypothetical protein
LGWGKEGTGDNQRVMMEVHHTETNGNQKKKKKRKKGYIGLEMSIAVGRKNL